MATLDQIVSGLPADPSRRGREWELRCRWFLLHDPVYASLVTQVWRWDDWPGRWGPDAGIDLIAEARDGSLWAVQAKAYAPTTAVTKANIDSFLSESNREQITFRLLIATTDRIGRNAKQVIDGQQKPASLLMLSDLRDRGLDWPDGVDGPALPPLPSRPRRHQQEALSAIERGVPVGGRGRVIMACGTGKTLVQLWCHELFGSGRTLVLVPSLFLITQAMQEWARNRADTFEFLAVCSDETVVGDGFVANVSEVGVPVTTDPVRIRDFLGGRGRRVIFCTYQSSARVADALDGTSFCFDLVLADEAHQLAGTVARDFVVALDDDRLPAGRRLFFTATPRYFTGSVAKSGGERDLEIASMDDESRFGPEVYRLPFGQAIRRGLLSDYRVVVVGVTDREAYDLARDGAFVDFDGKQTDARSLARQVGLAKAMRDYRLRRLISFHSRVVAARRFAEELPGVIAKLPVARAPAGRLVFSYVSGEMPTGERRIRLNRLRSIGSDEYALLANARCLSEGVDVPSIDGVAFIDPRRSQIDIVQAVGRAIRLSPDKQVGTIVVPVLVPEGEDSEDALAGSVFEPVWAVVRALRDHDEELAEQLDAARRKKGREGRLTAADLPPKVILDVPQRAVGTAFTDAFVTRVVEKASSSWEEGFAALFEYIESHGTSRVPMSYVTNRNYPLGRWVVKQRTLRHQLVRPRIERLEALPQWTWNSLEARWDEAFGILGEYAKRHGSAVVPGGYKTPEGFRLGQWVVVQRSSRHLMSNQRQKLLESVPGWIWKVRDDAWERGLEQLIRYVEMNGSANVPTSYCTPEGYRLGSWVQNQIARKATLELDQITRLEGLKGWWWDRRDQAWEKGFAALVEYKRTYGAPLVPAHWRTPDGFPLGQWVANQRSPIGQRRLTPERRKRLGLLDGWSWRIREDYDESWERGYAALTDYVRLNGHARVPIAYSTPDGFKLGAWVSQQRTFGPGGTRQRLSEQRVRRLEQLNGWTWGSRRPKNSGE